ncbi:MAG: TetR/AcrR family transcriptional regulator [Halioglobus sp.]|nr:TetR/AcrR family transcriptional regulator [Halioglobus sp.]
MPTQPLTYSRRRELASRRRENAVIRAAGACFSQYGFKKTTTAEIARRAGVSKGLVFHFHGDKTSLFRAVIEDSLEKWTLLSDYRAYETGGSALAELESLFLASFEYVEQHPILSLFTSREEELAAIYKEEYRRKNVSWRRRIRKTLKRGIAQAEISPDIDIARVAIIFHELQTSLIKSVPLPGTQTSFDQSTVALAIRLLLRGIALNPGDIAPSLVTRGRQG